MPTLDLTMLAIGSYNNWTNFGGASEIASLNVDDGDTSFIYKGDAAAQQSFTLTGFDALPATALIEKLEHVMKIREEVGTHNWGIVPGFVLPGTPIEYGTARNTTNAYTQYTEEIGRPSGGSWSKGDLSLLEYVLEISGTPDGHSQRATFGKVIVTWVDVVEIPQHVHQATRRLLQLVNEEHRHSLRVPIEIAWGLTIGEPFSVQHADLLLSASRLAALDPAAGEILDKWRRQLVDLIGITEHAASRTATLHFVDAELGLAEYFCSERIIGSSGDTYPGMAQMDVGGKLQVGRTTEAYIVQESALITTGAHGSFIARVRPYVAKRNHIGLLSEDAAKNEITDPAFANGLTSYSTTEVGGSVSVVTDRLVLPGNVTGNSIEIVGAAGNENSLRQSFAVLTANGYARVVFINSDRQASAPINWQVQRDTDSWWWNAGTGAWQSGNVANSAPSAWDAVNGLEIGQVFYSDPIPIDQDENWTVRVGAYGAVKTHNLYLLNVVQSRLRFSPMVDTATTDPDSFVDALTVDPADPVRQLHHGQHGTIELEVTCVQDLADLETAGQYAFVVVQYGSSVDNDFDAITYEKPSSGAARWTWQRWLSGSLDAKAYFEVDMSNGLVQKLTARSIGPDAELGLLSRTLRLRVNGVNGVDAIASDYQDETEKTTKLWIGCIPTGSSLGWHNAMNYIAEDRFQARVITDEEDPA